MKRFLYASIATLCLSIAAVIGFHIGSQSVRAQSSKTTEGGLTVQGDQLYVCNLAGDVWVRTLDSEGYPKSWQGQPRYVGNIFTK